MATTGTTNSQGALFELVARGRKDAYFFADDPASTYAFDNTYKPQTPFLAELRYDQPKTPAAFGRTCEFDIPIVGDILSEAVFVIDLPSWLPPEYAAVNYKTVITDSAGVSYGWTNSIGYFLFERIQFLQDGYLLQEWSGDGLWGIESLRGTLNSSYLSSKQLGTHDGEALDISRNATPGRLRLSLPLPGCAAAPNDSGFPLRCLTRHAYKLRVTLRRMEDLVEASDRRAKPVPWDGRAFRIQRTRGSHQEPFRTLMKSDMSPLGLQLETRQLYVTDDVKQRLQTTAMKLPFHRIYESVFTQSAQDYVSVLKGGTSVVQRRIESACHPSPRMVWFFRSREDLMANRYATVENPYSPSGSYYNTLSLLIAGQARELARPPLVWKTIVAHAKLEIDTGTEIGCMDWTRGAAAMQEGENAGKDQPDGSINFTTADKPTLLIDLTYTRSQETELRVLVVGWAQMEIADGRGGLLSAN